MCTENNARPQDSKRMKIYWNGLPFVLFACLSHRDAARTPLCVVGTSLDQWSNNFFTKVSRVWRNGRFPKGHPATAQLAVDGARIEARFKAIRKPDYDFNQLNEAMFTEARYPAPLPQQFGFLCYQEAGRPFAGRPLIDGSNRLDCEMYEEMCRCWKCRYMHHYNVNAGGARIGGLVPESPAQTSVHCNPPFNCAEDIVQSQCADLRSRAGQQAIPMQPEPDIH